MMMFERWRIGIIGIALSVALSVALTVLVSMPALLGFAIGLLGTVVSLQLEVLVKIEPMNGIDETIQAIRSRDDRASVHNLLALIAGSIVSTLNDGNGMLAREATETLEGAGATMQEIAEGRFRKKAGEVTVFLEQVRQTRVCLKATTDLRDVPWWESHRGRQFLAANAELIGGRGVRVERIFFADDTDAFDAIIREHRALGVFCYKIVVGAADITQVVNMTIFDDKLIHQDEHNPDGSTRNHLYSFRRRDVVAGIRLFDQLKAAGTQVT